MIWLQQIGLTENTITNFQGLFIALGIGLLLGLEREFSKKEPTSGPVFAGIRTFPIVALIGFVSGILAEQYAAWVIVAALFGVFALIALSYQNSRTNDLGTTTEFSLLITFLLGALVYSGKYHLSVSVAVIVTILLSLKISMHRIVEHLSRYEIFSILIFVIITALFLPLLPDKDLGPYGLFNPYRVWLIVVIFVSLNFLFYFLEKFLDDRKSILTAGVIRGFASSTATTWIFSRQSSNDKEESTLQAAAIVLASSIMFFRLLIWLFLLNQSIFLLIILPISILGFAGVLIGIYLSKRGSKLLHINKKKVTTASPINFKEALLFTTIFIIVQLLVGYANSRFGATGTLLAAGISGISDIDAITISLASFGKTTDLESIAATGILVAAFSNTFVKYLICLVFGSKALIKNVSLGFIPLFLGGLIYFLFFL